MKLERRIIGADKTKIMTFTHQQKLECLRLLPLQEMQVEIVKEVKYLEFTLDAKHIWNYNLDGLSKKKKEVLTFTRYVEKIVLRPDM